MIKILFMKLVINDTDPINDYFSESDPMNDFLNDTDLIHEICNK